MRFNNVRPSDFAKLDRFLNSWDTDSLQTEMLPMRPYLLVCTHGQRDTRCGTIGGMVYDALISKVGSNTAYSNIEILRSSHVGGHKYAGKYVFQFFGCKCIS